MGSQRTRSQRSAGKPAAARKQAGLEDDSEIRLSEEHNLLTVRDRRMFQRGQESVCRALICAAARQPEVRAAQVDLGASLFRLEFNPGRASEQEMAERFAAAMRQALAEAEHDGRPDGKRTNWAAMAAFPAHQSVSTWEIVREETNGIKLRNVILRHDSHMARRIAKEMRRRPGILSARVSQWRRDLKIRYEEGQMSDLAVVNAAEEILQRLLRNEIEPAHAGSDEAPAVATGIRKVYYIVLASGSFALTVLGFIVPGVPTVPFLMATSYYLVRSSPWLNNKLRDAPFFGPILKDLQSAGALRPINKVKLIGLTLVVGTLTVLITLPPVGLILLISAVSGLSMYAVSRIPTLGGKPEESDLGVKAPAMA